MTTTTDHVMIDEETLGTAPGSIILSVGLVRFDPCIGRVQDTEELLKTSLLLNIDLQESIKAGFTFSADTLIWWMSQSREAQKAAFEEKGMHPYDALVRISAFVQPNDKLWANGANFDPGLAEAYYDKFEQEPPWRYSKVRCARTVYSMNKTSPDHPVPENFLPHSPVADCIYQIQKLQSIANANPSLSWR